MKKSQSSKRAAQAAAEQPASVAPPEPGSRERGKEQSSTASYPVVGVGASAGGLEAFRELLKHLPADTGMAFVLVQHLDPHHESLLASLLAGSTAMAVREARDNMPVEPNCVYVIPPDTNMGILHERLQLVQRQMEKGRYLPVDWFLRTLAEDRGSAAIGVILSGTASDGTLGLKAVKAAGGITFAQDETSAEYFGMPGSAIAAGCVDFVLSPQEIAREIGRIARHPFVRLEHAPESIAESPDVLNKVFLVLRSRTGHDFTYYKHSTIKRRIKRRMLVHKLERLADYVRLLQKAPAEVDALFEDILINVTGFFRDPDSFKALQQEVFPRLLEKRPPEVPLRIWVPGCSTGEEAYSLAIALMESMGERAGETPVQIFATDIDARAIDKARVGIYPERIADELDPGRLKRFFLKVAGGFQVSKTIRDLCVFAEQDVTKDPPFSKLDLVCCRNLLIYLGSVLQRKVLQIFHYALQPHGYLMVGTSETIGSQAELFRLLDKKNKIYARKSAVVTVHYEFTPRAFFPDDTPLAKGAERPQPYFDLHHQAERLLLSQYAPPGVVISRDMEILHFFGETGPYLNPTPGSASLNLLKMARQDLAAELRALVHKVGREGKALRREGVRMRLPGGETTVDLQAMPLSGPITEERCLLVLFEENRRPAEEKAPKQAVQTGTADQNRVRELEQELSTSREYMQSIIEEQEATNEELKSANEEIQSANEELQSTNEELETAKEELQSTNEELATVNEELENRNIDLGAANNDLTNLLASVNLPILMLGQDLRIRQFTPQAEKLLNLIETDIGRPISQIRANVEVPNLEALASEVIDTMVVQSLEVQDSNGRWYNLRVRPYKTLDNHIEGAVITVIDIDDLKGAERLRQMQESLQETEERLRGILDNSATLIFTKDLKGRYQVVNKRVEALLGLNAEAIVCKTDEEVFPSEFADTYRANDQQVIERGEAMEFEECATLADGVHTYLSVKFPIRSTEGTILGVGGVATDITHRNQAQQQLQRLATLVRDANDAITVQGFDGAIQAWNPAAERIYGWSEREALGMNIRDMVPPDEQPVLQSLIEKVRRGDQPPPLEVTRLTRAGAKVRVRLTLSLLLDERNRPRAVATTEHLFT